MAGCLAHSLTACRAGWLLVHVRDVICLWGCLWKINKQRRHNVCVFHSGDMRSGRNQSETETGRQRKQRQRQRKKTPAGNAIATLRVVVFSLVDSGSTCVDDVAVAGSRVCALSLSLFLIFVAVAISFQLTSLGCEYC